MSKQTTTARPINTDRFPGESDRAYKKRMARNKRVRERRAKQRAAKKASKRATRGKLAKVTKQLKKDRRGIPRRAADLAAAAAPPATKKLAQLILGDEVVVYVQGVEQYRYNFASAPGSLFPFVNSMTDIGLALGADTVVMDLRPPV